MKLSESQLRYPIGKAAIPDHITEKDISNWIQVIEDFPSELEALVSPLTEAQLDTPYRDGGWTVRQVVHHLADSHMNSFIRFKWTLTEEQPVIKAYFEERWAELPDGKSAPIGPSLDQLKSLHSRWTILLRALSAADRKRTFIHPEGNKQVSLEKNTGIYAWHSKHHYAHIANLLQRKGWL